ncbi:glycosyltransferase family 4 protein [Clostridium sp. HBUAS56017]|uniref:glycosyltransferase family 4 protein n=1 Tax=Clostridium sp. HBUAS56017 TaxID=2571128 RepID=UPI001177C12F|nr:glycosyltransferase family 4 protein [Clostridium sp. HBUAS56017]
MKICIVTNIPSPYRVDFFNFLADNTDYEITIIYSSKNEDNRSWEIDKSLIKNSVFLKSKTIKLKKKMDNKYIHIPVGIIGRLKEIKPDVVIGCEYNPTILLAFIWCKIRKLKYISWSDGTLNSEKDINKVQFLLRKLICRNADSLVASSTATKMAQIKYGAKEEKIFISLLTVDIDKYIIKRNFNKANEVPRLIYVGSLIKRKGVDLLLDALSLVNHEFVLNVVGEGEEKYKLEAQARELGIMNKVKFLGYLQQNDLKKVYAESDIFILPTREDCFGLVIIEAMCAGLKVIVSKYADGANDLIVNGDNGLIIDPFNKTNFAISIESFIMDKKVDNELNKGLYKNIDKFNFKNVTDGFVRAIKYAYD